MYIGDVKISCPLADDCTSLAIHLVGYNFAKGKITEDEAISALCKHGFTQRMARERVQATSRRLRGETK